MRFIHHLVGAAALLASTASASPAAFSPPNAQDITYSVGVPSTSATSSSGGNIYLQLKGPATYRWFAMGIGTGMSGAHIFLVYAAGDGNVTVSPRLGVGHVQPLFDPSAQVTLLAGSGVVGGVMTANIQYSASASVISLSSSSTNWIGSWQQGSALNTKDQSATITQHDDNVRYTFDLTKASIAADSNPYVASGSSSSSATSTGASSSQTSSSSGSSSGSSTVISSGGFSITTYEQAHGILMASSMVVLLPLGAIFMRLFGGVWVHAAIQLFTLCAIISGFGLGIFLAQNTGLLYNTAHTIFGTIIVCLFLLQPILGLLHHRQYMKIGKRSYFGFSHLWYGRILIICGVINGGLGLQLAANSTNGEIAYGVVAGVIFIIYIAVVLATGMKKRYAEKQEARSP